LTRQNAPVTSPPGGGAPLGEDWDPDEEVDLEIAKTLLKQGRVKIHSHDYEGAEKYLQGCLGRLLDSGNHSRFQTTLPQLSLDAISSLVIVMKAQQNWEEAEQYVKEKIALESRRSLVNASGCRTR
jgi:hypothetical protein